MSAGSMLSQAVDGLAQRLVQHTTPTGTTHLQQTARKYESSGLASENCVSTCRHARKAMWCPLADGMP